MISKHIFKKTINAIKEQFEKDVEKSKLFGSAFPNAFEGNLLPDNDIITNALISLLEYETNDKGEWIKHFISIWSGFVLKCLT